MCGACVCICVCGREWRGYESELSAHLTRPMSAAWQQRMSQELRGALSHLQHARGGGRGVAEEGCGEEGGVGEGVVEERGGMRERGRVGGQGEGALAASTATLFSALAEGLQPASPSNPAIIRHQPGVTDGVRDVIRACEENPEMLRDLRHWAHQELKVCACVRACLDHAFVCVCACGSCGGPVTNDLANDGTALVHVVSMYALFPPHILPMNCVWLCVCVQAADTSGDAHTRAPLALVAEVCDARAEVWRQEEHYGHKVAGTAPRVAGEGGRKGGGDAPGSRGLQSAQAAHAHHPLPGVRAATTTPHQLVHYLDHEEEEEHRHRALRRDLMLAHPADECVVRRRWNV